MEIKYYPKGKSGCVLERENQGLFQYEIIFKEINTEIPTHTKATNMIEKYVFCLDPRLPAPWGHPSVPRPIQIINYD